MHILDADGNEAEPGVTGEIVMRLPLPPGCLPTLWHDDDRFIDSYLLRHDGAYITGDGGFRDADGYLYVMGRINDVINVAGHRLSTGEMEEVLASHPAVAECAVIGVHNPVKGEVPRGFVTLKAGIDRDPALLSAELVALIRERIGPVAALRRVDIVEALPGKHGPGRSCARRCAASPTARTSPSRPPSTTQPPSTQCGRCWSKPNKAAGAPYPDRPGIPVRVRRNCPQRLAAGRTPGPVRPQAKNVARTG